MPAVWFTLKKSLQCRSEPSEVYDPKAKKIGKNLVSDPKAKNSGKNLNNIFVTKKSESRSGCSRSISHLKDVIHGSKRFTEKPPMSSPRSIGSSEFHHPITHEVVFNDSTCEIKITGSFGAPKEKDITSNGSNVGGSGSGSSSSSSGGGGLAFVGTLKPGTPGPGGHHHKNFMGFSTRRELGYGLNDVIKSKPKGSFGKDSLGSSNLTCHKCGEQFVMWEAVQSHHLSKHAVTELVEGDSSRKIVEMICQTGRLKSEDNNCRQIERILKVHNMQKTIAQFEEYREMVKIKASKLQKKHPRCLADGNELLRFHGTTLQCNLGMNGSSSLCNSEKCKVCQILRLGFSSKMEIKGGFGVFTASTSGKALDSVEAFDDNVPLRKALIVCRVIAGRVHRPLENFQELTGQSGFDSVAGKMGVYSNIEELFLLNPRALLPCFVVIFKS